MLYDVVFGGFDQSHQISDKYIAYENIDAILLQVCNEVGLRLIDPKAWL